ncbi:MAG: CPBP family intramembrane glutamic endopeptidase [Verrucomicrobiota bacterium]|nr:CPBP family intramembrane glutamic endopeptidase [Verrucomicrobiota bacterium]
MPTEIKHRALTDLAFVGLLSYAFVTFNLPSPSKVLALSTATITVVLFILLEHRRGVRPLASVGLRTDNLIGAFKLSGFTLFPLLVVGISYAILRGVYRPGHFVVALLLYPLWGLVQQILFQGIALEAFRSLGLGWWSILLTNALFVAVHYPSTFLMKATAIGGLLFSATYYFRPNVIPLAIYHGVFGAFLYYVFRQKDALGSLLN